jgi:DNA polymerase III epsilon subunit-like protein
MSPIEPTDELPPLFCDTETTGLDREHDEVISVSIIDGTGLVLLDTKVRPVSHTSWPAAQAIHGIRPEDVLRAELPTMADLAPRIAELTRGRHLICYNALYDCAMLRVALVLGPPAEVSCAMERFAVYWGHWSDYHQSFTWQSLTVAAAYVLHVWEGAAHGSLADTFAVRTVWNYLESPAQQAAVAQEKDLRARQRYEAQEVKAFLDRQQQAAELCQQARNDAWTAAYYHAVPTQRPSSIYAPTAAQASADAFSEHLHGHRARTWNTYGKKLKLRRYDKPAARPAHLAPQGAGGVHFLRRTWRSADQYQLTSLPGPLIEPVAMQVMPSYDGYLSLAPLFDLRKLTPGVDYVPYAVGKFPEGHCTATDLRRKYKLKEAEVNRLRPVFMRRGIHQDYFIYPVPVAVAETIAAND